MIILNLVDESKSDIKYKISEFPDGQQNIVVDKISLSEIIPGITEPVYYSHCQIKSRLNNWLDLELITCAVASLRELEVKEIHLYVPYILGARSDRKFEEGGNNYLKDVICPAINALGCETVTCIDPHSDVLEACIKGFKKISNLGVLQFAQINIYERMSKEELHSKYILVSPDAGASKKIYKLAEKIGYKGDIITCSKERDSDGKLTKCIVPYIKSGKDHIIIDDICDGGQTFINIAKTIKSKLDYATGKKDEKIYLIVTHGIFSKGFQELSKYFDSIYCTNSYKDISDFDLEFGDPSSIRQNNFIENVKQLNIF